MGQGKSYVALCRLPIFKLLPVVRYEVKKLIYHRVLHNIQANQV